MKKSKSKKKELEFNVENFLKKGWESSNSHIDLNALLLTFTALKLEPDKAESLTRKVMLEKVDKNMWIWDSLGSVNLDEMFQDTLKSFCISNVIGNYSNENSPD